MVWSYSKQGCIWSIGSNISIASLDSSTALGMTKNSLDCHVPLSGTRNDKPSIVFLGRMEEVNGIEVLLEAARKYKKVQKVQGSTRKYNNGNLFLSGRGAIGSRRRSLGKLQGW